jgi:hypothetical protein
LVAKAREQFFPGNAAKTRIIVALGNEGSAAFAGIDHAYSTPEAGEIDRRGQSGRAGAND